MLGATRAHLATAGLLPAACSQLLLSTTASTVLVLGAPVRRQPACLINTCTLILLHPPCPSCPQLSQELRQFSSKGLAAITSPRTARQICRWVASLSAAGHPAIAKECMLPCRALQLPLAHVQALNDCAFCFNDKQANHICIHCSQLAPRQHLPAGGRRLRGVGGTAARQGPQGQRWQGQRQQGAAAPHALPKEEWQGEAAR